MSAPPPDLVVYLVRHGEKFNDDDSTVGLSRQGCMRAHALVGYFRVVLGCDVAPDGVYAGNDTSQRPLKTVVPLARSYGMVVQSPTSTDDVSTMARLLIDAASRRPCRRRPYIAIVAWQHGTLSALAVALGAPPDFPSFPDSHYDVTIRIERRQCGAVVRTSVAAQQVLPSDNDDVPNRYAPYAITAADDPLAFERRCATCAIGCETQVASASCACCTRHT